MKRTGRLVFWITAFAIGLAYCFLASRPMTLASSTVSDGGVYMATAGWILEGKPAGFRSANTALPLGYPHLIAALKFCGLGENGLFGVHVLCLVAGLAAFAYVARAAWGMKGTPIGFAVVLTLASVLCLQLASTVASEVVFFGLVMVCLAGLARGTAISIVVAACVGAAAISVRTAGVALIPAMLWAVGAHSAVKPLLTKRNLALTCLVVGASLIVALIYAPRLQYASIAGDRYNSGTDWTVVLGQQVTKLSAFGELATNLGAENVPSAYRAEFVLLGAIVAVLIGIGWWSRRRDLAPVDIFAATYAAIVFIYPFFFYGAGRRFLFPVLTLLVAYTYLGARHIIGERRKLSSWAHAAANAYLAAFVLIGCIYVPREAGENNHMNKDVVQAFNDMRGPR